MQSLLKIINLYYTLSPHLFSVFFGYTEESLEQSKADLEAIRPMLDEMFGFEKTMAERARLRRAVYEIRILFIP